MYLQSYFTDNFRQLLWNSILTVLSSLLNIVFHWKGHEKYLKGLYFSLSFSVFQFLYVWLDSCYTWITYCSRVNQMPQQFNWSLSSSWFFCQRLHSKSSPKLSCERLAMDWWRAKETLSCMDINWLGNSGHWSPHIIKSPRLRNTALENQSCVQLCAGRILSRQDKTRISNWEGMVERKNVT